MAMALSGSQFRIGRSDELLHAKNSSICQTACFLVGTASGDGWQAPHSLQGSTFLYPE
jgi:hypothetical protein